MAAEVVNVDDPTSFAISAQSNDESVATVEPVVDPETDLITGYTVTAINNGNAEIIFEVYDTELEAVCDVTVTPAGA